VRTYTREEGEEYGFAAAVRMINIWEYGAFINSLSTPFPKIKPDGTCTCCRGWIANTDPNSPRRIMVLEDCENCGGHGIVPIPWDEVKK